jgi:peroxiredoxin Q/BCP
MYGKKVLGAIRSTFVIRDGKIVKAFPSVKVDGHAEKVLDVLRGGAPAPSKKQAAPKKSAPKKKAAAKKPAAKKKSSNKK